MSASPLWQQKFLDLGGRAHFDLLHGLHRENITIATGGNGENWCSRMHAHATAAALAFEMQGQNDVYISQSGFSGQRRLSTEVTALTSCFVDLDIYTIDGLSGLTVDELLDRMRAALPWLPLPTVTTSSGRGYYVHWMLRTPLPRDKLPRWAAVQHLLVASLAAIGADANAKDASRVFRIVGSVNSKSREVVSALQTGEVFTFESFERLVLTHALPARVVRAPNDAIVLRFPRTASPAQRHQYVLPYQLAFDRMLDYARIALLRGSPQMDDCRGRLLYCHAVAGAWFWTNRDQAEDELDAFARQHFSGANRYTAKRVRAVLNRMEEGKRGERELYDGILVNRRYRMQTRTIINILDLSPAEQVSLQTIIGPAERQNRRAARRRAAGMAAYASRTKTRTRTILEGLARGLTQRTIADGLGISQPAVAGLLKKWRQQAQAAGGSFDFQTAGAT